jgi:hypothetical protein
VARASSFAFVAIGHRRKARRWSGPRSSSTRLDSAVSDLIVARSLNNSANAAAAERQQ